MQKRVVITGIGVWGCLGKNTEETTAALRAGQSGIGIDEARLTYGYQSALTGIVERPVLKGLLDRRMRTGLPEEGEYAFMASREAFAMAGIDDDYLLANEVGCIFGNDSSSTPVIEAAAIMREKHDSQLLGSGYIFQSMNSTVTMNLSTIFHLRGINFTVSAACASGGAAALVLEEYDHAVARGATILCEVVGYGFSSNGGGISQPSDEGSVTAMTRALNDANLSPADIDYVNAHATSTLQGDMFEAIALDRLFGQHMPWISSTKGLTGHECWMAGASEVVYSILMMQGGFVAPNINFENPDEHSAKLRLATHRIDTQVNTVLSNSFGFGGTNSALIIKK